MLQVTIESSFFYFALFFILFGLFAIGWLVVHVEHARHFSKFKVVSALILGAIFLGFGIHFLLLTFGI
ncbi:MAG: hypothetical protein ACFFED_02885 [Candidatus Thorarchaeota archaeon]